MPLDPRDDNACVNLPAPLDPRVTRIPSITAILIRRTQSVSITAIHEGRGEFANITD